MISTNTNDSFSILEFDKILEKILGEAFSDLGKKKLNHLPFFTDPVMLEKEQVLVTEMRDCLKYDDAFPLSPFPDFTLELKKSEVVGTFLRAEIFVSLKHFLILVRQIKTFFNDRLEKYSLLKSLAKRLIPLVDLEQKIHRILNSSAELLDHASAKLYYIRQQIRRQESDVRKRLDHILREMVSRGFAQENNLVLRDSRLVIPMKDTSHNRLKGMIVDQSASGATLFIEPFEIVEMNNEIRKLKIQEKLEEEEILRGLTSEVRNNRHCIQENLETAAELDSISARARFSLKIQGQACSITRDFSLELKGARHPLLLLKLGREQVVPLGIRMGEELKTIIMTGPNAGGKTVALKTIGLLALMHQHGLHIPVDDNSSLPFFSNIFADIGDRQSIEQDLSTFSSHIQIIKTILDHADAKSLVLLDEIGSATDPDEGAALARSILNHLTQRGCLTLVTTHLGTLKVFAHETTGVANASMAFDQKTLRPTYHFQMGIPGSSYAMEIAQRFGLSELLIREARTLVGLERGRLDQLICDLEKESRRVHELLSHSEIQESRLSGLIALYQEKINQAREEGEKVKQIMLEEAEVLLKETNRQAENILRELKESKGNPELVNKLRSSLAEQKKNLQLHKKKEPDKSKDHFNPGDWVLWEGHGGKARVLSETDRKGKLWVQWENIKLKIPVTECQPSENLGNKEVVSSFPEYTVDKRVKDEVDLRGLTVEESFVVLDRYLSDVAVAGFSRVRIIHGKGTGVLRREVGNYLKNHTCVKSQRLGNWNEGDTGVTIIELK